MLMSISILNSDNKLEACSLHGTTLASKAKKVVACEYDGFSSNLNENFQKLCFLKIWRGVIGPVSP